ncbi:MAG: hypothetical protein ACYC5Y_07085 [Symbiobacteriia bacterium]
MLDSSALVGYINVDDDWNRVLLWLFNGAILKAQGAPHTFVTPHILGEFAYRATKGLLRPKTGKAPQPLDARRYVLSKWDLIVDKYPMAELLSGIEPVLEDWRESLLAMPFGVTEYRRKAPGFQPWGY